MAKLRALLVIGTRPEAIKMAPVVRECLRRRDELETTVCLTGQHREMLDQVTRYFDIPVHHDLDVMRPNQSLNELAWRLLQGLDGVMALERPHWVVAQGDTTTVLAAALAAFHRRLPLVHVEAGLRTGDVRAPWPEELNRRVATLAAALHCAPTARAAQNLLAEGVPEDRIHVTGNTIVDALLWTRDRERAHDAAWNQKYAALGDRRLVLITGHRRESFGLGLEQICRAIARLADQFTETEFLYAVHPNPSVEQPVGRLLSGCKNVHLVPPATYPEFVWLMDRSALILTDSGGVQEEAPSLGKPVLVLRDATERPEAIAAGAAELVGTDTERIVQRATRLLTDEQALRAALPQTNPYGDGRAAERIAELLLNGVPYAQAR